MFSKSNLLATIVGAIFLFIGGYLIWGVLTVDFFAQHVGSATGVSKEPDMLFIAIGCIIEAFFLSTIYGKWANSIHSAKEGFVFGAFIGAFFGFGEGMIWYGTTNLSDLTGVLTSGLLNTIFVGIAGVIVAMIYKSTTK
jgi:ABC-type amino acid transport system permease subunit